MADIRPHQAIELLGPSQQGQTIPLYVRVDDGAVFLCKVASRRSGLTGYELSLELIGNLLARASFLVVADIAVVALPQVRDRIEELYGKPIEAAHAVGTLWRPDLIPFLPAIDVSRVPMAARLRLVALDLILANSDWTRANPNVAWSDDAPFIFDFERCLEFRRESNDRNFALHQDLVMNL